MALWPRTTNKGQALSQMLRGKVFCTQFAQQALLATALNLASARVTWIDFWLKPRETASLNMANTSRSMSCSTLKWDHLLAFQHSFYFPVQAKFAQSHFHLIC